MVEVTLIVVSIHQSVRFVAPKKFRHTHTVGKFGDSLLLESRFLVHLYEVVPITFPVPELLWIPLAEVPATCHGRSWCAWADFASKL